MAGEIERLLPDPGPTLIDHQLEAFAPAELAGDDRPYVFTNFVTSVDGHATIEGRAGALGSDADLAMLMGLRGRAEAVLVGAGTVRAERYGRLLPDAAIRERRTRAGLPPDPLAVVVTRGMDLPWEAGLFSSGEGEVLIFTSSELEPPETATPLRVVRGPAGAVELADALAHLRRECGVRALLCEGGPRLHGELLAAGLLDELFVTIGPLLAGGTGPRIVEQLPPDPRRLELRWLLRREDELFARYAVAG